MNQLVNLNIVEFKINKSYSIIDGCRKYPQFIPMIRNEKRVDTIHAFSGVLKDSRIIETDAGVFLALKWRYCFWQYRPYGQYYLYALNEQIYNSFEAALPALKCGAIGSAVYRGWNSQQQHCANLLRD